VHAHGVALYAWFVTAPSRAFMPLLLHASVCDCRRLVVCFELGSGSRNSEEIQFHTERQLQHLLVTRLVMDEGKMAPASVTACVTCNVVVTTGRP
jgi:hypothetical protein